MQYPQRFNHNIETFAEAKYYFQNRSKQLMYDFLKLDENKFQDLGWGCHATFNNIHINNKQYHSVYVYNSHRGQNKLKVFCEQNSDYVFVTSSDCNIESWFVKNNIKHIVRANHTDNFWYKTIEYFYGNTCAKRSRVPYMNHIDEGLFILMQMSKSLDARAAYCLHPVFQNDNDLIKNCSNKDKTSLLFSNDRKHILLAMEYRSIANEYLAHKIEINNINQIRLSPLQEVNDMLVADKIQNYKDFILYHKETHPNSKQLEKYFKLWLEKLEVSDTMFNYFFNQLK